MNKLILFIALSFCFQIHAQVGKGHTKSYFLQSEYNKETTLYKAKEFLADEFYSEVQVPTKLIVDPLVAATSGELTTVLFTTESNKESGLLLGFYGNYWNSEGVIYQGYGFKILDLKKAYEFLELIEATSEKYKSYLWKVLDNSNVVFKFEDMTIIMYSDGSTKMRILWGEFDSLWSVAEAGKNT